MLVNPTSVNAAYQAVARMGGNGADDAATGAAGDVGKSFSALLEETVKDAVSTMRVGEVAAADGAAGKADLVQVVNAVTAAELTLETVVAIRDRVISAYQDIIKMPI